MGDYSVKKWFNISEIADILGCSRPTVYKRIDTIDKTILQSLQKREKNVTYYSYTIIDMLRGVSTVEVPPADIDDKEVATDIAEDKYLEPYIESLRSQIESLNEQLHTKDIQIKNYDDRLKQEQDLHQNTQILFKQQQPAQDIKTLEAHFEEFDNKLIDIKEKMQERKEQQENKGLFKRLFKNK